MKLFMFSIFASLLSAPAFAATPADFFEKAVKTMDSSAQEIKIVTSYNPFNHASRVLQYLDRAAQQTIGGQRVAWAFYRVQYTQKDGTIQDCVGGIGYKLGYSATKRLIDIEQCSQDFFHATTQFKNEVDLSK